MSSVIKNRFQSFLSSVVVFPVVPALGKKEKYKSLLLLLYTFYLFHIKISFYVLQNDSITESTLTGYFALMLDLYDPFEQDILFNPTFELEYFLLSFFIFFLISYNQIFWMHEINVKWHGKNVKWHENRPMG